MHALQRYFIPENNWDGKHVIITGEDAHHIVKVMRNTVGDLVICNHPSGKAGTAKITELNETEITLYIEEWLEESSELPVKATIVQGLPKGDKFELVLQKGTELGAYSFIPFQAERSVVKWDDKKAQKKLSRYQKIVKEASEQCHRNTIPHIKNRVTLPQLVEESKNYDVCVIAYEEEAKTDVHHSFSKQLSQLKPGESILICIGPEGGFSPAEIHTLKEHAFVPVRLGRRILRTETAALYALASISYHFEELECS